MSKQDQKKKKTTAFPISRLKKIMQCNENVGKLGASVPVVASRAIELFLKEFVGKCVEDVKSKDKKRVTPENILSVIEKTPNLEFLKNTEGLKNI